MKAIVYTQHRLPIEDPQSLHEQNLPEPAPGPRDLRVKVRAIAVNPVDMKVRTGSATQGPPSSVGMPSAWSNRLVMP